MRGPAVHISELYVEPVGVHGELHSVTLLSGAIELTPTPTRVTDEPHHSPELLHRHTTQGQRRREGDKCGGEASRKEGREVTGPETGIFE
jgi:hypothetical protein